MLAAMLPLLALAACYAAPTWRSAVAPADRQPGAPFATLAAGPRPPVQPYVLQVGDELAVKFYNNPELNEEVAVRPDGMISLQLVNDVRAAGLTPTELDRDLAERYRPELADPKVSVIVKKPAIQRVYVGGEVGKQGELDLTSGLTLFQAIQGAGGFTKTGHRKQVILIRKGADGRPSGRAIDVRPIQSGEHPEEDVPLRPYDIVFVPRSKVGDVNAFVELYIRNSLPITTLPIPAF